MIKLRVYGAATDGAQPNIVVRGHYIGWGARLISSLGGNGVPN